MDQMRASEWDANFCCVVIGVNYSLGGNCLRDEVRDLYGIDANFEERYICAMIDDMFYSQQGNVYSRLSLSFWY